MDFQINIVHFGKAVWKSVKATRLIKQGLTQMLKMLIDTCVWLDLAKNPKQVSVLGVVEELLRNGMLSLIVPRIVLDEFKRNRERISNAMADAILIETYAECLRDKTATGVRFAFVTHNKRDFSIENGNHKNPHTDFADLFSRIKSLYFINLPDALRRVEPALVNNIMLEQSWTHEPRCDRLFKLLQPTIKS